MVGHSNDNAGVTCCFCNESIKITKIDPCDINIMTNWDEPQGKKKDQTFWCHYECFRNKMHTDVEKYLVLDILLDDNEHDS
jgi:hypothetical protein